MAANVYAIFPKSGDAQWAKGALAANTTTDLTSGTIYLIYTASTEGDWIDEIIFRALGTNVATVARVWLNNGSSTGTAANNCLIDEITLPATAASQTSALAPQRIAYKRALKPTHRLYITLGTAVAAGYDISCHGGPY